MENLGIFYDHLVYITAIGNILWPFGILCGNLVYFSPFGVLDQEKSGNPAPSSIWSPWKTSNSDVKIVVKQGFYKMSGFYIQGSGKTHFNH
jgi:hypothetical protein